MAPKFTTLLTGLLSLAPLGALAGPIRNLNTNADSAPTVSAFVSNPDAKNVVPNSYIAVYNSTDDVPVSISFDGLNAGSTATLTILTAPAADSYNDIGSNVVASENKTVTASSNGVFSFNLPALSVSVLEVHGGGGNNSGGGNGNGGGGGGGSGTSTVTSSSTNTSTGGSSISSSGGAGASGTATSITASVSSSVSTGTSVASGSRTISSSSSSSNSTPSGEGGRRGGHGGFGGWTPNNGGWGNCTGRND